MTPPPNFGVTAQNSPLHAATCSSRPKICATVVIGLFWALLVALWVRLRSQFLGIFRPVFLHACLPPRTLISHRTAPPSLAKGIKA